MKKIIIFLLFISIFSIPVFSQEAVTESSDIVIIHNGEEIVVPDGDSYTIDEIIAMFDDAKFMIMDFKQLAATKPFTFALAIQWGISILISLMVFGGLILFVCWGIKWFTPPEVDEKIEVFENKVRKFISGPLMTFLNMLRIAIRGK